MSFKAVLRLKGHESIAWVYVSNGSALNGRQKIMFTAAGFRSPLIRQDAVKQASQMKTGFSYLEISLRFFIYSYIHAQSFWCSSFLFARRKIENPAASQHDTIFCRPFRADPLGT